MMLNKVSLNTIGLNRIGLNRIGKPSRASSDRPYIDPEVLASLKAVCICYGKSNDDPDRAVVKNLVDPDNPFVISNAAFKLNSGFGKYEITFQYFPYIENVTNVSDSKVVFGIGGQLLIPYSAITENIPSFKIKVSGLSGTYHFRYYYRSSDGVQHSIDMAQDGYYELPICYNVQSSPDGTNCGFANNGNDVVTITQIPSFEGAFVTDGIDDLITSTKTVQEMLGGSNEITVVSMAHFIKGESNAPEICRINQIRRDTRSIRNSISKIGKSGIFGYTYKNGVTTINNILGDKNDCTAEGNLDGIVAPFSVEGYYYNNNSNPLELCSIAWYWTFIANKVLTTDQINQVIAYFNLDRTLKPDILCNTIKQGITNDNHAEFGDKLIDFSGNGRDIQLNNLAWKGGSGIAAKPFETIKDYTIVSDEARQKLTIYNEFSYKVKSNTPDHYWTVQSIIKDNTSYQVTIITDKDCYWINSTSFINNKGNKESIRKEYPVKANTPTQVTICGLNEFEYPEDIEPTTAVSYVNLSYAGEVTVTFIPSCKGGLLLDGVNDFGQFVGDLGLKDYTLIMNRAYNNLINNQVPLVSSNIVEDQTPFIVEHWNTGSNAISFSYGASRTTDIPLDINKKIVYQSTYSYMGYVIPKGNAISTGGGITLGKFGNGVQYSAICLWSLMLFPYSMSEFLIERQLKKHKLGTLYPDMVEFRPIVTYDKDLISKLKYFYIPKYANWVSISPGDYLPNNAEISFTVDLRYPVDEVSSNLVFSNLENVRVVKSSGSGNSYDIRAYVTNKSPQKINITIDEYIRYENIVQPYPVLLRFNDENGNEVSWGGKFKVGSTITRIGSIADPESNLLNGLYSISGLSLNGKAVTSSTSIVEKQMVFRTTATWLLDNNEPKVILSPSRLRIPNSSYKLLGYIPDISGHGNNGKINNSAYEGMSGVNGYPVVFGANKTWANESNGYVNSITNNTIHITNVLNAGLALLYSYVKYNGNLQNIKEIPPFKIEIKGLEGRSKFIYKYLATSNATKETNLYLGNGTHELPKSFLPTEALINNAIVGFSISPIEEGVTKFLSDITIEVLPEYEGAYCLDGVDDFVTIPTTVGGKQVLMKVNWQNDYDVPGYMYDSNIGEYRNYIIKGNKKQIAYENASKTYIDGIQNSNITSGDLKDITHNITSQFNVASGTSYIGCRYSLENFLKMSLYDFMLFDDISTDDKIKQLNEYVGIEGNVWGTLTQLSNSTLISNETLIKNE